MRQTLPFPFNGPKRCSVRVSNHSRYIERLAWRNHAPNHSFIAGTTEARFFCKPWRFPPMSACVTASSRRPEGAVSETRERDRGLAFRIELSA